MNILTTPAMFSPDQIKRIEEKYGATYICETCLADDKGNWRNEQAAVFYAEKAHPEGSNYFGLYWSYRFCFEEGDEPELMITDAITAVGVDMHGIVAENGDVIYSHYRHDYRNSPDKTVWIDGGRDYARSGAGKFVTLRIVGDKLTLINT